MTRPSMVQTSL